MKRHRKVVQEVWNMEISASMKRVPWENKQMASPTMKAVTTICKDQEEVSSGSCDPNLVLLN